MARWSPTAPGLARVLADRSNGSVTLPAGACSVRGIEAFPDVTSVSVSTRTRLAPLARLPNLRHIAIDGRAMRRRDYNQPPRRRDRVRLQSLAGSPALASLMLYAVREQVDGGSVLCQIPTLRTLEVCGSRCPDLSGLADTDLERLDLDGATGVRPRQLAGLRVKMLDLWGCMLDDIEVISTMPALREVWLLGNSVPSLRPLLQLSPGARVYLGGDVDPAQHRAEIAALESRGIWLLICAEPHENGFAPSWWGSSPTADDAAPIRYQSPFTPSA